MGIKVAINGYGRIGRQVLRAIYDYNLQDQLEVVAVNASGSLETNAHLTKFDTVHGRFNADISHDATHLIINGRKIPFFSTRNPAELPWRDLGVDLVMECTGSFTSKSKANVHLESGAKKVLISAPGEADVDATIVYGVNDDVITDDMTVISNASCTTNCLAPVAKVLSENIGIVKGAMTTIHALTNDQTVTDVRHKDLRRARSGVENMIPTKTGAAKAVGLVLPELKGQTRRPCHPRADRQCFIGGLELPSRARYECRRNQCADEGRLRRRSSERRVGLQHAAAGVYGL